MPSYDRALHALRTWLDSWTGIGLVAVGMHPQGYDLQLTQYDEKGWRATFYTTGMEHSPTSTTGTGWERTPWHATQRAAWEAWRWTKRRWYAIASAALLTVLPAGVAYWCGRDVASVVIYWLTALVVLAYSYETYGMRLQMIRQNEIAIQPLLITSIEARLIVAPGSTNRDALIIRNIGRGAALYIRVEDIDIALVEDPKASLVVRFETVDSLELGKSVEAQVGFYSKDGTRLAKHFNYVPNLNPKYAVLTHEIALLYKDVDGGERFSVMQMGKAGTRLLRHGTGSP